MIFPLCGFGLKGQRDKYLNRLFESVDDYIVDIVMGESNRVMGIAREIEKTYGLHNTPKIIAHLMRNFGVIKSVFEDASTEGESD